MKVITLKELIKCIETNKEDNYYYNDYSVLIKNKNNSDLSYVYEIKNGFVDLNFKEMPDYIKKKFYSLSRKIKILKELLDNNNE